MTMTRGLGVEGVERRGFCMEKLRTVKYDVSFWVYIRLEEI